MDYRKSPATAANLLKAAAARVNIIRLTKTTKRAALVIANNWNIPTYPVILLTAKPTFPRETFSVLCCFSRVVHEHAIRVGKTAVRIKFA